MSGIAEIIKSKATEYGADVSALSIGLAIEAYRGARNFPASYGDDIVLADMTANINKIAMAAIEIDSKDGMENQLAQTENGVTRTFYSGILAYRDVVSIAVAI